jgi:YHS domain-containing protein
LLTLVDAKGNVRGVYDSDDASAWRRIAADAEELATTLPARSVESTTTGSPLAYFGCNGCHERAGLAPRLSGAVGRRVKLATGEWAAADDDYLRESILKPNAKVVAGYAPLMPSYAGALDAEELAALIDAIRKLPGDPPAQTGAASGSTALDPICQMQVSNHDPALSLQAEGKTYHFCSHSCLETFRARRQRVAER